jgi:hypothetical protein
MSRHRKTFEEVARTGLPEYTKKQAEQHLRGEKIDRTPCGFVKFEWPKPSKEKKGAFCKRRLRILKKLSQ